MSGTDRLQRFVRSRMARLGLAVALIALSAWAFIPYVGYRISSSAFVNAELVRVTAPIAGRLTRDIPRKAKARADLARGQLAEIAVTDTDLAKRTKIYRDGMIARLKHERDETKAEKTGCLAEAQQRRDISSRMEQLVKSGVASSVRSAETTAVLESITTRYEMAGAKLQRLQIWCCPGRGDSGRRRQ